MAERSFDKEIRFDDIIASIFGLACLAVLFEHSDLIRYPMSVEIAQTNPWYALYHNLGLWVRTFTMPTYFALSGYLVIRTRQESDGQTWTTFWRKRFQRLLLPYIAISSVVFVVKAGLHNHVTFPVDFSIQGYLASLLYPYKNAIQFFWFLPTLILLSLSAPILCALTFATRAWQIVAFIGLFALASIFSPLNDGALGFLNIGGALHFALFFWLGTLAYRADFLGERQSVEGTESAPASSLWNVLREGWGRWPILVLFLVLSINATPAHPVLRTGCSLLGVFSVAQLCRTFGPYLPRWAMFFSRYTYQTYLLSWFVFALGRILFLNLLKIPMAIVLPSSFVVALFLCSVAWCIEYRIPFLAPILGIPRHRRAQRPAQRSMAPLVSAHPIETPLPTAHTAH